MWTINYEKQVGMNEGKPIQHRLEGPIVRTQHLRGTLRNSTNASSVVGMQLNVDGNGSSKKVADDKMAAFECWDGGQSAGRYDPEVKKPKKTFDYSPKIERRLTNCQKMSLDNTAMDFRPSNVALKPRITPKNALGRSHNSPLKLPELVQVQDVDFEAENGPFSPQRTLSRLHNYKNASHIVGDRRQSPAVRSGFMMGHSYQFTTSTSGFQSPQTSKYASVTKYINSEFQMKGLNRFTFEKGLGKPALPKVYFAKHAQHAATVAGVQEMLADASIQQFQESTCLHQQDQDASMTASESLLKVERTRVNNPSELRIKNKSVLEAKAQGSVLSICKSTEKHLCQSPNIRSSVMRKSNKRYDEEEQINAHEQYQLDPSNANIQSSMKQHESILAASSHPVEAPGVNRDAFEVSNKNLLIVPSNAPDSLEHEHAQDHNPEQFERVNLHNQNFQSISTTFKNEISQKKLQNQTSNSRKFVQFLVESRSQSPEANNKTIDKSQKELEQHRIAGDDADDHEYSDIQSNLKKLCSKYGGASPNPSSKTIKPGLQERKRDVKLNHEGFKPLLNVLHHQPQPNQDQSPKSHQPNLTLDANGIMKRLRQQTIITMKNEHLTPEDYVKKWAKKISKLSVWEKNKVAETIRTIDKQLEVKRRERLVEEARIRAENVDEDEQDQMEGRQIDAATIQEKMSVWARLAQEQLHKKRLRKQCAAEIEMKKQLLAKIKNELEGDVKEEAEEDDENVDIFHQQQSREFKRGFGVYLDQMVNNVEEKTEKMKNINKIEQELNGLYDKQIKIDTRTGDKRKKQGWSPTGNFQLLGGTGLARRGKRQQDGFGLKLSKQQTSVTPSGLVRTAKRGRLPALIRKHILNKKKQGMDIPWLSAVLNLVEKVDNEIFNPVSGRWNDPDSCLGFKYASSFNIWANNHQKYHNAYMNSNGVHQNLLNIPELVQEDSEKMNFYKSMKNFRFPAENDAKLKLEQDFFERTTKNKQLSQPIFAKLHHQQLFLTEFRISDIQAQILACFLADAKGIKDYQIRQIVIDDCGMTDYQFSLILDGLKKQGRFIETIIYSTGQFGAASTEQLVELIPSLRDVQLINLQGGGLRLCLQRVVRACNEIGMNLKKIKFSNINLNDALIVEDLCQIIELKESVTHLDVSWACLSPQYLFKIAESLLRNPNMIMNLNLSYNSVSFKEHQLDQCFNSEDFLETFCEYLERTKSLNHIDLSGLSFERAQLKMLCPRLVSIKTLIGIHLSDMGIKRNPADPENDIMLQVLDFFGIDDTKFKTAKATKNLPTKNPKKLRKYVRQRQNMLESNAILSEKTLIDPKDYQNHIIMTKQCKLVSKNKLINQTMVSQGIGRVDSGPEDIFVLTRKLNNPELMFNNCRFKDLYWEIDSSEKWHLSFRTHPVNDCYICQKYKYAMIFIDKRELNAGLDEIKDPEMVSKIAEYLNLEDNREDFTPIICGTVMDGGFTRKLQMMRSDLFSLLCVSQSEAIITQWKQQRAIKKGVSMIVTRSQQCMPEIQEKLRGWQGPLKDKALNNELVDVEAINVPDNIRNYIVDPVLTPNIKHKWNLPCSTFAYAAYLPPGLHQFLIYVPGRQIEIPAELKRSPAPAGGQDTIIIPPRVFCCSLIINLSQCDFSPEVPYLLSKENPPQNITSNVWRLWRRDTAEDIEKAFHADTITDSFDPHLFMKDEQDIQLSLNVLKQNFEQLQICFIENVAQSYQHDKSYPEISSTQMLNSIMAAQVTEKMQKSLPRSKIELCILRSTRGDDQSSQGTLSRSEFFECILRMVKTQNLEKKQTSEFLQPMLDDYIKTQVDQTDFMKIRAMIHEHKRCNSLLHRNQTGLEMLYTEAMTHGTFTMASAENLFNGFGEDPKKPLVTNLRQTWVYSLMTNMYEEQDNPKYFSLKFVEFQDLLCRVALQYSVEREEEGRPLQTNQRKAVDLEDKVYVILEMLWSRRMKNQQQCHNQPTGRPGPRARGSKRRQARTASSDFPELQAPTAEGSDED